VVADVSKQAVNDKERDPVKGSTGSSIDARRLGEVGQNQWVKQDRFARIREVISLLLDPIAVM
jgi:hypothetical protein